MELDPLVHPVKMLSAGLCELAEHVAASLAVGGFLGVCVTVHHSHHWVTLILRLGANSLCWKLALSLEGAITRRGFLTIILSNSSCYSQSANLISSSVLCLMCFGSGTEGQTSPRASLALCRKLTLATCQARWWFMYAVFSQEPLVVLVLFLPSCGERAAQRHGWSQVCWLQAALLPSRSILFQHGTIFSWFHLDL